MLGKAALAGVAIAAAMAAPAAHASPGTASSCKSPHQAIKMRHFVRIGGIEQWIDAEGDSCGNPVILFLHGGPGNPLSPFSEAIYGPWTRDYTLVQWDQRGAGMTYGRSPPAETDALTLERMTADGIEVAEHLIEWLGPRKIILMGSSWGSILGVKMVQARPDLFHAYIGTSQVVSYRDNEASAYAKTLRLAKAAADQDSIGKLEAIGAPPWQNPRNFGILRRVVRKYEKAATDPFPAGWWEPKGDYATPKALADYEAGEEYSFLQFVGMKGDGMFSRVELRGVTRFEVPIFLVQGAEDLLTTPDVTGRYFASLQAPQKALVTVPRAGHDPNKAMIDAQRKLLDERVRPLIK